MLTLNKPDNFYSCFLQPQQGTEVLSLQSNHGCLNKPQPVMVLTTFTFSTRGHLTAISSIMGRVPSSY